MANELLTVAPPPARSFAYMTDTLFRERFADYVRVDLLYHEATYMNADAVLAKKVITVLRGKQPVLLS